MLQHILSFFKQIKHPQGAAGTTPTNGQGSGLGWRVIMFVWVYCLVFFLIEDCVKTGVRNVMCTRFIFLIEDCVKTGVSNVSF